MKIDITNKSPYQAVIDAITDLDKEDGLTVECCRIVRIRTTVLGEDNEFLGVDGGGYYWDNDWYEGGEVELLGFIRLNEVKVPEIRRRDE